MKKLKTIYEHNEKALEEYDCYNGIECPKCKTELFDVEPLAWEFVYPFKYRIGCPDSDCNFVGWRY